MARWFRRFKWEWMNRDGYLDFEQAVGDIKRYVMYYNFVRPHRYNQGLPPIFNKTTYRRLWF